MTDNATEELNWWIKIFDQSSFPIERRNPEVEIKTDAASSGGWGAVCGPHKMGGRWSKTESAHQCPGNDGHFVRFEKFQRNNQRETCTGLDRQYMCSFLISNMGGSCSPDCNDITKQIWMWCKENAVWISVSHIPGIMNTEADVLSRQFNDHTEWKLSPDIFHKVTD